MRTDLWQGNINDKQAQRQLFEQYGERLYRVAYRYLDDRMAAEDVTSEALVKIYRALAGKTFEHQNLFEAWLRRIVINQALQRLRQHHRWRREEQGWAEDYCDGEGDILASLSLQEVLLMIKTMPTGYRTVLQLYAFDGYSHAEIASELGISVGTSKSQLNKARNFLRQQLKKANSL